MGTTGAAAEADGAAAVVKVLVRGIVIKRAVHVGDPLSANAFEMALQYFALPPFFVRSRFFATGLQRWTAAASTVVLLPRCLPSRK